jgi:hypothetical protein
VADNQYDSKSQAYGAIDMYSLALGVVPPANLAIPAVDFCPRYLSSGFVSSSPEVGFDKMDAPRLRSIGFFCNLADGLVDANGSSLPGPGGFILKYGLDRIGPRIRGRISNTAGSATVTGDAATRFTEDAAVGMSLVWSDANGATRIGVVSIITDDATLTLTAVTRSAGMFTGATANRPAYGLVLLDSSLFKLWIPTLNQLYQRDDIVNDVSKIRPIVGLSSFPAAVPGDGTMVVTGVGTRYLRDVTVGQYIRYATGTKRTLIVQSIQSDTQMTLTIPTALQVPGIVSYPVAPDVSLGWMDYMLGVRCELDLDLNFYTISADAAYGQAGRAIIFHGMAEIEHTYDMFDTF